jgi:hypothetical protein
VLTSAVLVDVNPTGATARVTSVGLPDGPKSYVVHLERADAIWKASDRQPDTAPPYVPPTTLPVSDSAAPPALSAAPVVSAAPVASGPMTHKAPKPAASH